jgi:hypothetical protein
VQASTSFILAGAWVREGIWILRRLIGSIYMNVACFALAAAPLGSAL